ncbi:MAG: NADH-quinone oxidoreductase subunit J [Moorellales bacterium]
MEGLSLPGFWASLRQVGAFWLLAGAALGAALAAVTGKNIVRAAFSLVLSLVATAGLFLLLEADFLAMVQLLVYAGAISVLLVFAIMLTRRPGGRMQESNPFGRFVLPAGALALFFLGVLVVLLRRTSWGGGEGASGISTVGPIGEAFLTTYVLPLELAGILLLVALVGAIMVAGGGRR